MNGGRRSVRLQEVSDVRIIRPLFIILFAFSAFVVDANARELDNPGAFHIRIPQTVDTSSPIITYNRPFRDMVALLKVSKCF